MKIQQWLFELLRKQSVTDGRTDARTDARTDNVKTVYPLQTKFAGGIKNFEGDKIAFKRSYDKQSYTCDHFILNLLNSPKM